MVNQTTAVVKNNQLVLQCPLDQLSSCWSAATLTKLIKNNPRILQHLIGAYANSLGNQQPITIKTIKPTTPVYTVRDYAGVEPIRLTKYIRSTMC